MMRVKLQHRAMMAKVVFFGVPAVGDIQVEDRLFGATRDEAQGAAPGL